MSGPKMFQLGSLVVLCGLLTGTSASLSEIIQKMNMQDSSIQEIEIQDKIINNRIPESLISLDYDRHNFSLSIRDMTIQVDELRMENLQARLSSSGNSIEMKMSLVVDASVHMPNDNSRDNTTIALERECSVRIERESQNSLPYVTMWKCSNETMKDISDSSGRQNTMMDSVMDIESSSFTERVSLLIEKQIRHRLTLVTWNILSVLLMEENQSPSEEEGAEGGML